MWLIDGLPLHPLVVHAPVVLVPMLAAGLVLFLASPRSRSLVSLVLAALAAGAAVTAVLAVASGQQLAEELRLGDRVATHESRGGVVRLLCIVLAVGTGLVASWQRSAQPHVRQHAARWLGGSLVPSAPPAGPASVAIRSFTFEPATVTVAAGQSVVWSNEDPAPHTASGDGFDTGSLARNASSTIRFDRRGRFDYICDIHPAMTGTVVVQ